ncbi:MAG: nuclear transport factor 2 family protein [Acidimicrobiales bacterium]
MSSLSRRIPVWVLAVLAVTLIATGCSDDDTSDDTAAAPVLADVDATGRELATEFLTILQGGDTDVLGDFLADGFQIQRADGSGATKAEYLENPAEVGDFTLGDSVTAVQQGDVLTVRWTLEVSEAIDGTDFSGNEAPRLSTFVYVDGRWRLLSHANFNLPAADS